MTAESVRQPRKSTKYGNRRCEHDGISFASEHERDYYLYLCKLRDEGEVRSFVLQPKFLIQPAFQKHGKKYRPIHYIADFGVVYADGTKKVIDVKGATTSVFELKAKMYAHLYDEPLVCVKWTRNGWREWTP